jgi:hypothetical protein
MSAMMRGTQLLFAHEANRINTIGRSSPRDDPFSGVGRIVSHAMAGCITA